MVPIDLLPLIDGFAPTSLLAVSLAVAYFCLVALVASVATFAHAERSKNAYRVLKLLTRRKPDPPGSGSAS